MHGKNLVAVRDDGRHDDEKGGNEARQVGKPGHDAGPCLPLTTKERRSCASERRVGMRQQATARSMKKKTEKKNR